MQAVMEKNGKIFSVAAEERQMFSGTALRILRLLAEGGKYPKEMSRELRMHEQKVYYHVRRLEKKGFIKVTKREEKGGALAKVYELSSPSFLVRFGDFRETRRIPKDSFEPFIKNGKLDARIIVGSTEPHGPEKARSRDVSYVVDLALFLGTFLTEIGNPVLEDKDAHVHDLKNNLIIIGGPVTNKVAKMMNSKLPVRFDSKKNIISPKKTYKEDECGFVAKADNPMHDGSKIIVIAGKRYSGTRAAVLGFIQRFDEIRKKNYTVVEGLDNDGDGEIDSVRILE